MKKFVKSPTEKKALMSSQNTENRSQDPAKPKTKRQRIRGVTKLYRACEKILRSDGELIADALFQSAIEGNVSSAKLLLKIIELEAHRIRKRTRQAAERKKERQKEQKQQQKRAYSTHPAVKTDAKTQ